MVKMERQVYPAIQQLGPVKMVYLAEAGPGEPMQHLVLTCLSMLISSPLQADCWLNFLEVMVVMVVVVALVVAVVLERDYAREVTEAQGEMGLLEVTGQTVATLQYLVKSAQT